MGRVGLGLCGGCCFVGFLHQVWLCFEFWVDLVVGGSDLSFWL